MPQNNRKSKLSAWLSKHIFKLAVATSIGMFIVVMMGTLVTNTESQRGCGDDWPLCNGKFVPAYTLESLIEWSHRFVTGIISLLVLATLLLVLYLVRRKDAKWYAWLIMLFTVLQGMLGAFAVIWPQSSAVLALHFGVSLLAFASTVMLVVALAEDRRSRGDLPSGPQRRAERADIRFSRFVWFVLLYCYVVVYTGAYVRHTDSSGGCGRDWPLCTGELIPDMHGSTGIMFLHRIGAMLMLVFIVWLVIAARRCEQPDPIRRVALYSLYLVILQIVSGAWVTKSLGTDNYVFASLLHAVLISCLFAALCFLAIAMLRIRRYSRTAA